MRWVCVLFLLLGIILGLTAGVLLTSITSRAEDAKVALWVEVFHRICTGVGGLGTVVALVFVVRQFNLLRQQSELLQKNIGASMDSELYARLDSFNKFIVEHAKEYDLLDHSCESEEVIDHRSKLHRMCELGFTFFEEIFKHHLRYKLLDTEDWEEWQENMKHFFGKAYVRGYWSMIAGRYAKSFQAFANDLVERMNA
jgi:hypothetical protein